MAQVRIEALSKSFEPDAYALEDVTLKIEDGEFFVLVGPSGCGKSTLLRTLAGLEEPTAGEIYFDGEAVTSVEPRRRNVAMVFQDYALYPHKRVFDNVAFALRARGEPERLVKERVREAAALLGIERLLARWPRELSGGERQRVAIGRAIVRRPVVFLLDEPLSNLDARLREEMRGELSRIHSELGVTTVLVTHDQIEAMTLGHRVAVMRAGRVQQVDRPASLYDCPCNRFVAEFLGSPSMNFLEGVLRLDDSTVAIETGGGTVPLAAASEASISRIPVPSGSAVALGVRPESIRVDAVDECRRSEALEGRVLRVEPLGHEGLLHLDVAGSEIVCRTADWRSWSETDHAGIGIPLESVHLFSASDGARVWGGTRAELEHHPGRPWNG